MDGNQLYQMTSNHSELEQREFEAILLHAVRNFPSARKMAESIIELAEKYKVFEGTTFGHEKIYKKNDAGTRGHY